MQDIKNFYLAWVASAPALYAIDPRTLIWVLSAIILPIFFFAVGKAADILLQIYLHDRKDRQKPDR